MENDLPLAVDLNRAVAHWSVLGTSHTQYVFQMKSSRIQVAVLSGFQQGDGAPIKPNTDEGAVSQLMRHPKTLLKLVLIAAIWTITVMVRINEWSILSPGSFRRQGTKSIFFDHEL